MKNTLIVIENGKLMTYPLDDRVIWEVGRISKDNLPDIRMYSINVSRKQGRFQNKDGVWFYVDYNGKNGTVRNGKRIRTGIGGRLVPVLLNDGDVFFFGGGDETGFNDRAVWALFTTQEPEGAWQIIDTKEYRELAFECGEMKMDYQSYEKGTMTRLGQEMVIYMGDITFCSGTMQVLGR